MSLHLQLAASAAAELAAAADDSGSGRLGSVVAALVGIAAVAIGGLALKRTDRWPARTRQNTALTSLVLGLAGAAISAALLADSAGEVGTGNGRGGAIVGLAIGVLGIGVGGLATTRSRRAGRSVA
jgi:hypothetical protein